MTYTPFAVKTLLALTYFTMSLLLASRANVLLHRSSTARFAPVRQITANRTLNMSAASKEGQQLNKSTPDSVWKTILNAEEFHVLREKGTERAGSGIYNKHYDEGTYVCAGCGTPIYKSETKFNSGCGWPAFYDEIEGALERHVDMAFGMKRTEITCSNCGGHLGHVFEGEGFPTPTNQRHCVNSVSIKFKPNA